VSIEFICFSIERVVSCEQRKCTKMVFLVAIREKSLHGVALSCDAHVMSASSGKIRQPCTRSSNEWVLSRTFSKHSPFCAGKLRHLLIKSLLQNFFYRCSCVCYRQTPGESLSEKVFYSNDTFGSFAQNLFYECVRRCACERVCVWVRVYVNICNNNYWDMRVWQYIYQVLKCRLKSKNTSKSIFCRRILSKRLCSAKETCIFMEPPHQ